MNRPRSFRLASLATIGCLVALTGCATTSGSGTTIPRSPSDAGSRYTAYAGQPVERFTAFDIDSWEAVSDNQLVLWTGISQAYLITLWDTCRDLQFVERIGVSRAGATVSRFDRVFYEGQSCPISEIRPIDVRQLRADRKAERERERGAAPRG